SVLSQAEPVIIGSLAVLRRVAPLVGLRPRFVPFAPGAAPESRPQSMPNPPQERADDGVIGVVDLDNCPGDVAFGQVSAKYGRAAYEYIERAIRMALAGD